MIAVEAVTREDGIFIHVASTIDKAVEWIKKNGQNWCDEDYCFIAYTIEVDKDDYYEKMDDLIYISKDGVSLSADNPLFNS